MEKLKTILVIAVLLVATFMTAASYTVKAEETLIWCDDVYSSGEPVTSPVLEEGKVYRIEAREIFWYDYANDLAADAQYYTTSPPHWEWVNYNPAPDGHSFLQINEMDVNWGPFSNGATGHTYSITYMGEGEAISFRIVDWIDGLCNNHCHLPVCIYLVPEYQGLTPGFWKNHPDVWMGYSPDQKWTSVFEDPITIDAGKKTANADPTLLEVLSAKDGINESENVYDALARHAVAAILNAAHPDVNYPLSTDSIISQVDEVINNGVNTDAEPLKNTLDGYNNLGGGIDAHGNPI